MADRLTLRIITPEHIALDTTASSVSIPATDGSMGILPRHATMIAALEPGLLHFKQEGGIDVEMFVSGGFAEVRDNTVRIVCEAGERAEEIDVERAREAEQRARERLHVDVTGPGTAIDSLRAEAALERARVRQRISGRRSHSSS